MYHASLISAFVLFGGHTQAQIKLDLFSGDEKVGTGTYRETFDHKGHRTSEFLIKSLDDADKKVSVFQVKVIDAQGFPINEEEHIVEQDGRRRTDRLLIVVYDKSGAAHLTEHHGKERLTERIFMPIPGLSRADSSDLWFSKTIPLPGTTVLSTVFDIEHTRWQKVETTYVGKRWITVEGRQIEANEIRDVRDYNVRRVYVDDKGQPLLMKNGPIRTERHF